jgi:hypothetical protein
MQQLQLYSLFFSRQHHLYSILIKLTRFCTMYTKSSGLERKEQGHYVRKPHPRPARTNNRDTQIGCLRRRVSHYRVIRVAHPDASPISIYWRHAQLEHGSHYTTRLRRTLRAHVTDLIAGWAPRGTNTRRPGSRVSDY